MAELAAIQEEENKEELEATDRDHGQPRMRRNFDREEEDANSDELVMPADI